ncbi:MAG: pknB, partial [Acidimicrobiales bacterium]|nr:pknB [Acidimicrobiales bacterium]
LLLAAGAAAYVLTRPDKHEVPNVTGKPLAAALAIVQNAGFNPNVERTTATAPAGIVIRQNPQPASRAPQGSTVTLTVSDGPGTKPVPDVINQPRKVAVKALTAAGFKVSVRTDSSPDVKKGLVISTSPPASTPAEVGSTVTVVVSNGPPKVAVPDVVGQQRADARAALEGAGFVVRVIEQEDASHPPGTVISQSPPANTSLAKGQTVTITVAKAPNQATVPDVTGLTANEAFNALSKAGFVPNQKAQDVTSQSQDQIVLSQSPPGGRTAKKGSTVTVIVGNFLPPGGTTTTPTTPTTPTVTTPPPTTSTGP